MKDQIAEIANEIIVKDKPKSRMALAVEVFRICKERGLKGITFILVQAVIKGILEALEELVDEAKDGDNSHSSHTTIYS